MLNSELIKLSGHFPADFRRDFDAHIYFDREQRPLAEILRLKAQHEFRQRPIFIGELICEKIGPHEKFMFEINYGQKEFQEILFWLMKNRRGLSVLIHQVTGDDPIDHDQGALWLGQSLPLDVSKLDPSPNHKTI